jgi:hypothetical protein
MYLFYMAHVTWTYDFDAGKSIIQAIGRSGGDFACCHFRAHKSLDFQGPPLPMAPVMDLPATK